MDAPAVVVEGAVELRALLRRIADKDLNGMLRVANKRAAEIVVQKALPNVPVGRTGRLRASLRATGSQRAGNAIAGKAAVPYAAAIHWGRKVGNVGSPPGNHQGRNIIKGRPFLWDAKNAALPLIVATYRTEVGKVFDALQSKVG